MQDRLLPVACRAGARTARRSTRIAERYLQADNLRIKLGAFFDITNRNAEARDAFYLDHVFNSLARGTCIAYVRRHANS